MVYQLAILVNVAQHGCAHTYNSSLLSASCLHLGCCEGIPSLTGGLDWVNQVAILDNVAGHGCVVGSQADRVLSSGRWDVVHGADTQL